MSSSVNNHLRTRRGSLASISTASQIDKEQLAQALDQIHTSASQSDVLTTFNDFADPPSSSPTSERKGGAGDLVQQGLSGLYSRLKEAVGVTGKPPDQSLEDVGNADTASRNTVGSASGPVAIKSPAASLPRTSSTATASTLLSAFPDGVQNTPTSPHTGSSVDGTVHDQRSSKASSIATVAAPKSTSSSVQNLPRMSKTVASSAVVNPSLAPITVSAFRDKDASRGVTTRVEDSPQPGRGGSSTKASEAQNTALSGTMNSLESSDLKYTLPGTSRRDESLGPDGGSDPRMSPVRGSAASVSTQHSADRRSLRAPSAEPRASSRESLRRPAVIDRISQARIIGVNRARSESLEPGMTKPSTISTSAHNSVYHDSFARHEQPQQLPSGKFRIPGTTTNEGAPQTVNARLESMRKQVVSKEFWMADETCKECFLCGNQFSAFRRKHHCRTCGCIFDSKCTSTISGAKFGVSGTLRVCKTCLEIINRRYDSGSDDSDNDSYLPAIFRSGKDTQTSRPRADDEVSIIERADDGDDSRSVKTPMMAIPATRRIGDSKILEIDAPQLSRPSSSRSLRSLAGRPISSSHRRTQSKSNFLGRFKATAEERAPFRRPIHDEFGRKSTLPAFHDDNIIDPELEPYMSEESSGDEQMSIFATMASSDAAPPSLDPDKANFGPLLSTGKRHRMRQGEKSISGLSFTSRGLDDGAPIVMGLSTRPTRRRNMSTASTGQPLHGMRSPRPRSGVFGRGFAATSGEALVPMDSPIEATKLTRSDSIRNQRSDENQLSPSSLKHVTKLLRQLLQDDQVPNADAWEKALLPILTRCADDVSPDSRNQDHMDIRHYVKLKRIPGTKPGDTSYVSGVIFSKNLALKNMPRSIVNPRIVIISFPIEYQRHQQHFMSLQPVIEQEKEYLRVVVSRIMTLRPQVLLAERSVAGVALQYLSEANVAVAYNVKPSVIGAVSRCAKASIISSLDMLALPVHVGQAAGFEVKTFVNKEIPGKKKTYIFISGCERELGCTIALRGAKADILTRMKRITEFMVYVVYNLKLESCLMRDEFIKLPDADEQPSQSCELQERPDETSALSCCELAAAPAKEASATQDTQDTQGDVDQGSETRQASTVGVQPAPLPNGDDQAQKGNNTEAEQGQEQVPRLISLHEHHTHVGNDSPLPEDVPMPTYYSEMIAKYETKILSASPFVKFPQPYLLMRAREQERRLSYLKRLCDQDMVEEQTEAEKAKPARFQLIKPEMVHQFGHKAPRQVMEVLHAVHDAEYDKARYIYETQTRHWENYLQGNIDLFDPYSHQNIVVLYSVICTDTKIPCSGPGLVAIGFYDEHPDPGGHMDPDCTLGQYVEDLSMSTTSICHANGCDRPMWQHHRTYVHEDARITVFIEKDTPLPSGVTLTPMDDDIYMWNYCKSCKKDMGVMVMSDSSWKYSFGKYLELSFWGKGLHLHPGSGCTHDHQKEHIRYFNFRGNTVRIHWDPIDLLEIIVPRARITWKVEHDLKLKNDIFLKCEERWTRFINSVKTRLKSIRIDSVLPDKSELCKGEVERLTKKAQEDLPELVRKLQDAYMNSKYYEVIPMNPVFREMLERVQEWDAAFAKFEADFLSDKDVRQLTMIQLKKMFGDNESKESLPGTDATSIISVSSEGDEKVSLAATQETIPEELDEKSECQTTEVIGSVTSSDSQSHATEIATPNDEGTADQRQVNALLGAVEPLDLATPRSHRVNRSDAYFSEASEGAVTREATSSGDPESNTPIAAVPIPAAEPKVVEAQTKSIQGSASSTTPNSAPLLAVKVEQLKKDFRTLSGETGKVVAAAAQAQAEQSRYALDRGSSRRSGLTVSPPMVRALSQSSLPFTRMPSGITKSPVILDSKNSDSSIGSELARVPAEPSIKSEKKLSERLGISALKVHRKPGQSSIPRYVHGKKKDSRVSVLAKHFEQLSREFEKERMKDRKQRAAKMHYSRAFLPRTSTKATVEVYQDVDQAVKELGHEEEQPNDGTRAVSVTVAPKEQPEKPPEAAAARGPDQATERSLEDSTLEPAASQTDSGSVQGEIEEARPGESQTGSDDEGCSDADHSLLLDDILMPDEPSDDMPKNTKTSLMKMLTNFWAERSASGWSPLEYPFNATDHIFIDSDVVVREDEPSSLIAFALSSTDYQAKLADIRRSWKTSPPHIPDGSEDVSPNQVNEATVMVGSDSAAVMSDSDTDMFTDEAELEKSLKRSTGTHLKYQFTEGSAKLLCKIFYAEQFDALRRKCNVADRIIESLSRCLKWDSRGGKTRSVFLKTLDDRLVMKSLSPIETQAFLKFAPSYFNIMAEALFHDLPSVIAKMLGFFQIIIKNPMTNTEIKLDLLVMENLFYDRSPDRIFDLKGSMRNRKIQSTGEQNEVLLDENMVEYIYESPLFAREHSKKILSASVWNDTLFLARQNVMDYSLMVAVDEARKELVVGIIDCIRTYTWDKKLESWIKDRGFAGGGRNRPTVTSPKEYKSRFREAMARYILQAPNCWHQFGNTVMMSGNGNGGRMTRFEDVAD